MAILRSLAPLILLATVLVESTSAQTDCGALLDICFLVDISGSICDSDPTFDSRTDSTCSNWNSIINFIVTFVENLNIGPNADRMALITFGNTAEIHWDLGRYSDIASLQQAIRSLNYVKSQTTDTASGLALMKTQVFSSARPNAEKTAIIISDGNPNDRQAAIQAATDVQNNNIYCYVVGISSYIDEYTLKYLSSNPKMENVTYFIAPTFSALNVLLNRIQYQTCTTTTATRPVTGAFKVTEATESTSATGSSGASGSTGHTGATGVAIEVGIPVSVIATIIIIVAVIIIFRHRRSKRKAEEQITRDQSVSLPQDSSTLPTYMQLKVADKLESNVYAKLGNSSANLQTDESKNDSGYRNLSELSPYATNI